MLVDTRTITTWFVNLLRAGQPAVPIGKHGVVPTYTRETGYLMVHVIDGETWGAPFAAPNENLDLWFQVDAVSESADHAQFLADRARQTVLARRSTGEFQVALEAPAPYAIADRALPIDSLTTGMQATQEGDLVSWPERYIVRVVGA